MVNFCLPMDSMVRLSQLSDFIWIEHHKSAIEAAEQIAFGPRGLRKIGRAACELTWQFLFPTVELPHAVYLLEDATFGIWKCILTSCLFSLEWPEAESLRWCEPSPRTSLPCAAVCVEDGTWDSVT
jgi:hypothetical protein